MPDRRIREIGYDIPYHYNSVYDFKSQLFAMSEMLAFLHKVNILRLF